MRIEQQPLPFKENELKPALSERTVHIHYHGHHKSYVDKLNEELEKIDPLNGGQKPNTDSNCQGLEEIIQNFDGDIYNLAAQAWNHAFYWECLSPVEDVPVPPGLAKALKAEFGNKDAFLQELIDTASSTFGSGWTWLVKDKHNALFILNTHDGDNPLSQNLHPLLAVDMWEHAFYLDFQNQDKEYLTRICRRIQWDFVNQNFQTPFMDRLRNKSGDEMVRMAG